MVPQVKLFLFVFWTNGRPRKRHYEINWPLNLYICSQKSLIHKLMQFLWSVNQLLHLEKFWDVFVVVVKNLPWVLQFLGQTFKKNAKMQEATNAFSWHSAWVIFKYLHFLLSYNYIDRNLILKYIAAFWKHFVRYQLNFYMIIFLEITKLKKGRTIGTLYKIKATLMLEVR